MKKAAVKKSKKSSKPNIIIITTDHHSWNALSSNGFKRSSLAATAMVALLGDRTERELIESAVTRL